MALCLNVQPVASKAHPMPRSRLHRVPLAESKQKPQILCAWTTERRRNCSKIVISLIVSLHRWLQPIVHPHRQSPQGETEHDARCDEFEDVDGMHAGKTRSAHDRGERKRPNDQRENDVSPRRKAIRHGSTWYRTQRHRLIADYLPSMRSICCRWLISCPASIRTVCSMVSWPRSACMP